MDRGLIRVFAVAMALLLLGAGSAWAIKDRYKVHLQAGNIIVDGQGGFTPTTLPKDHDAPITIFGSGKFTTVDGSLPPILKTLELEFDKHGSVDTTGLPKCTAAKLVATTVPQARKLCPGAIVGEGFGHAIVKFPEQAPIPANTPITIFNGPRIGGDPSVLAHAYVTVPVPTTFVVPVRIETIHNGRFGYRVSANIPKIAGGAGIPISGSLTVGRKWTYKGQRHSFVNARCPDGKLQANGTFSFDDGTRVVGNFIRSCRARGE